MATARSIVKGFIFLNLKKLLSLFTHLSSDSCLNSTVLNISHLCSTLSNTKFFTSLQAVFLAAPACSKSEVSAVSLDFERQRHDATRVWFITPCAECLSGSSLISWVASFPVPMNDWTTSITTSLSHHEKVKVSKTKHGLRGFFVRALSCEFFFATGSVGRINR